MISVDIGLRLAFKLPIRRKKKKKIGVQSGLISSFQCDGLMDIGLEILAI